MSLRLDLPSCPRVTIPLAVLDRRVLQSTVPVAAGPDGTGGSASSQSLGAIRRSVSGQQRRHRLLPHSNRYQVAHLARPDWARRPYQVRAP